MIETNIDTLLQSYIEESKAHKTIREIKESIEFFEPLINSYGLVGFFGYDVVPSDNYGEVAVVKLVYVFPDHRRTFKPVVISVFKYLEESGYKMIELHLNRKINNWFRKHLNSAPHRFIHLGATKEYLRQLMKQDKE